MRREVLTLGVMLAFSLSLAATSKSRPSPLPPFDAAPASSPSASASVEADLPDTVKWKPYSTSDGKVTAKTPPGASVNCTYKEKLTVCTVMRGRKLLGAFGPGGRGVDEIAEDLRAPKKGTVHVIHDVPSAIIVHHEDPSFGSFCEYAVESPSKLRAAFALTEGAEPAIFKQIALQDQDCLDAVAFASTLQVKP